MMTRYLCALILLSTIAWMTPANAQRRGIVGKTAPEWQTSHWHQLPAGVKALNPQDYRGRVLYLYFFQSWCPGCHRSGFPTLKKMTEVFEGDNQVAFAVIQTTFEGHSTNNASKLKETADRYNLSIPFGQSAGRSGTPDIMRQYRTGGTPWTVIIDKQGKVRFNDFHISWNDAKDLIKALQAE